MTDSSSESLMDKQQHRQTSGSPESVTSNTDRHTETEMKRYKEKNDLTKLTVYKEAPLRP